MLLEVHVVPDLERVAAAHVRDRLSTHWKVLALV